MRFLSNNFSLSRDLLLSSDHRNKQKSKPKIMKHCKNCKCCPVSNKICCKFPFLMRVNLIVYSSFRPSLLTPAIEKQIYSYIRNQLCQKCFERERIFKTCKKHCRHCIKSSKCRSSSVIWYNRVYDCMGLFTLLQMFRFT